MPDVKDSDDYIKAIGDKLRSVAPPYICAVFPHIVQKAKEVANMLYVGDFDKAITSDTERLCCPGCALNYFRTVEFYFNTIKERTALLRRLRKEILAETEGMPADDVQHAAITMMNFADENMGGPRHYDDIKVDVIMSMTDDEDGDNDNRRPKGSALH